MMKGDKRNDVDGKAAENTKTAQIEEDDILPLGAAGSLHMGSCKH
ncbi:hypothetical protein [Herminiimonas arsenitoxidans]|nr:hypothetical protein [Herminiimonas arsenitoxidans]